MSTLAKQSVFFSGPSGWKEIDPVHGLVKVEMDDPRVVEAQRLQVKFLPGQDLVAFTNTAHEVEITRLTKLLESKDDSLVALQVALAKMEDSKVAAERALASKAAELTKANEELATLNAELAAERSKAADTAEADRLRKELNNSKGALKTALSEKATAEDALKNKPAVSLPADTQRIADLERQLAARPAVTAAPQPAPAAVAPAPGWFASLQPVRTVSGNPLTAIAAGLIVLFLLSAWYGAHYWGSTPNQLALLAQSDLQTCNEKLANAKEVQKTTEGARDAANDMAAVAFAKLEEANKALNEKVAVVPFNKEPPVDKPKDESKLTLEVPVKRYAANIQISPETKVIVEQAPADGSMSAEELEKLKALLAERSRTGQLVQ